MDFFFDCLSFFKLIYIFFILYFFWICKDSLRFFGLFSKVLRLLPNFMEVTTEHQKWSKESTTSINSSFLAQRTKKALAEGQSHPQEPVVSQHSGLYLLVTYQSRVGGEAFNQQISYLWPKLLPLEGLTVQLLKKSLSGPRHIFLSALFLK